MSITITVPVDTHVIGDGGHTSDHNVIIDALTALGASAANTAGDTFSGSTEFDAGLVLGSATPSTPASGKSVLYSTGGVPLAKNDTAFAGALPISQSDVSTNTANTTGLLKVTKNWSIPAGDANVGTVYRIKAAGTGVWDSTQHTLTVNSGIDGANVGVGGGVGRLAATDFSTSLAFAWEAEYNMSVVTTGVSGTYWPSLRVTFVARATDIAPGTAAVNTVTILNHPTSAATLDTTASHTMQILAAWGTATAPPTMTGVWSTFERLGA